LDDIVQIFKAEVQQLVPAPTLTLQSPPTPTTSTIASTSSSASKGPSRMSPEDLLTLTPAQLKLLSPSVAPSKIHMDLYMKLSPDQMDVLPSFITVDKTLMAKLIKPRKKK
jgi:hypothetical protein